MAEKKATAIAAGSHYCYAIVGDVNEVYSWGMGYNYVLGTREEDNVHEPIKVHPMQFNNSIVKQVGAGDNHVVVLTCASKELGASLPRFEVDFVTAHGLKVEPAEETKEAVKEPVDQEAKSAGSRRSKVSQASKKRLLSQESKQSEAKKKPKL